MPKPLTRPPPPAPTRVVDIDLADTEVVLEEFADGAFVLHMPVEDGRLVLTRDQVQAIVGAFDRLGKEKGWL